MKKKIIYAMILLIAMSCCFNKAHSQSSSATNIVGGTPNIPFAAGVDYLGWAGSVTVPLEIRTNNTTNPQRINFYTDSLFRMVIDSLTGFVGVGKHFISPNPAIYLLDVDSGDINIGRDSKTDTFGYRIGHSYVLWYKGDKSDIFCGVGTG